MILTLSFFGKTETDIPIHGVSIDSRTLRPGELFAALPGERFDGHHFVDDAIKRGCSALLVARAPDAPPPIPMIVVPDVLQALGQAARRWRDRVDPLVIAVTGSCGKTTVKEMLARCLRQRFSVVHATHGNFNNHIGLPLTLLAMPGDCDALVAEMGMRAAGEIAYLAQLAKPHIGVITNILPAHLASLTTLSAIAEAKSELLSALPQDGVAILPHGQPHTTQLRQKAAHTRVVTCGLDDGADLHVQPIHETDRQVAYRLYWGTKPDGTTIQMACRGDHVRHNLAIVAATARAAGLSTVQMARGLRDFSLPAGRGAIRLSPHGWRVIDDTYNANPGSVQAALRALPSPTQTGRKIAVLADMLELGTEAESWHATLSSAILESDIHCLYTAGPLMQRLHETITSDKVVPPSYRLKAWHRPEPSQWLGHIAPHLRPGDVVLVKGSRGMKMERIVEDLVAHAV